jgi:hypothetical protein
MVFKQSRPGGPGAWPLRLVKSVLLHPLVLALVTILVAVVLLLGAIPTPTPEGLERPISVP